ncbi:MAG: phosphoribosyltransferase [Bacteroidetes bacterium]|nr:phosphoribosyltransferase [Bacteroidota bacterium]
MTETKNYVLDQLTAEKKLQRMAYEIVENNIDETEIVLAGIRENGSVVARAIQQMLGEISNFKTTVLTISLDKDMPAEVKLSEEMNFTDKVIILIDDVAMSGKTLAYALKPFLNFYPKKIEILVLVERSHKLFPVHPTYVGLSIASTLQEHIFVEVNNDKVTGAYLE